MISTDLVSQLRGLLEELVSSQIQAASLFRAWIREVPLVWAPLALLLFITLAGSVYRLASAALRAGAGLGIVSRLPGGAALGQLALAGKLLGLGRSVLRRALRRSTSPFALPLRRSTSAPRVDYGSTSSVATSFSRSFYPPSPAPLARAHPPTFATPATSRTWSPCPASWPSRASCPRSLLGHRPTRGSPCWTRRPA